MKEALCILSTLADSHSNRDSGYELPDCWFTLNRKLRGAAMSKDTGRNFETQVLMSYYEKGMTGTGKTCMSLIKNTRKLEPPTTRE